MYYFSFLNILSFFCFIYLTKSSEFVNITSNGIVIIGRKLYTVFGSKAYTAFWKIPYARPPIKELRFKPPRRLEWLKKFTLYNYSSPYDETCSLGINEDCLYLSLYVPDNVNKSYNFPIAVWLHEYSNYHGPDFLIDEELIVATVSFRTSVFGFLDTEDDFAPGNMGAKDILMALSWIRDNISLFGGDSSNVTVIGSGAIAILVASLILSNTADDLFTRVIIQSGSALSPADYRSYNFEIANKLYCNLNGLCDKFNRTKLYEILSEVPTCAIMSASDNLYDSTEVRDKQRLISSFGPTVETSNKHAFMNKHPIDIYKRCLANYNVDVMIGYNSLESLYKLKGFAEDTKLLKYLNYNFQYLLPFEGAPDEYGSKRYRKTRRKIMEFYFVNGTIAERSLRRYAKYVSDQVIYPLLRQARLHAESSFNNVYLYRFSFRGSLNIGWNSSVRNLNWSGATFGDEICYLFKCKSVNEVYNSKEVSNERQFIKKIARLWANFVKFGNPTPKLKDRLLGDIHWEPLLRVQYINAMNLGNKLKMIKIPEEKRVKFYDELKDELSSDGLILS